jgi:DNA polymerase III alpha subunit
LLKKAPEEHVLGSAIPKCLGSKIKTYGYLIALKQSKTSKGERMCFGTFIDREGSILDTVHFPELTRKYPFYGKGIYLLEGIVTEEFGYYTIEVGRMLKEAFIEDVRFSEEVEIKSPQPT